MRTALTIQADVHDVPGTLPTDGRQNTLLGLLAEGTVNCAATPKPQPKPEPAPQPAIFQEEEVKIPEPPKPEPKDTKGKEKDKEKEKTTKKPATDTEKGKKGSFFGNLFDKFRNEVLDDNSDTMNN